MTTDTTYFQQEVVKVAGLFQGSHTNCNAHEVAIILRSMGHDVSKDQILHMMKRVDPTSSGYLTLPQLVLLLEQMEHPTNCVRGQSCMFSTALCAMNLMTSCPCCRKVMKKRSSMSHWLNFCVSPVPCHVNSWMLFEAMHPSLMII